MTVATEQREWARAVRRPWLSVLVGIAVSALLAYLAARMVRWSEVLQTLHRVEYRYLVLAAIGVGAMHGLRAWRLTVILRPVQRVRVWPAFCYTAVGFLAILLIPLRVGELARPLLLTEHEKIPFATGLATVAVERCLDGLAFAGLIALAAPWLPLPVRAAPLGYLMGGGYLLLLGVLAWAWLRRASCLAAVTRVGQWVSPPRGPAIADAAGRFLDGLAVLPESRAVGSAALLSAAIWLVGIWVNYVSFFAVGLTLPVVAAAALQILIVVGVLLPAAPGAVGSFQFFTVMGLALFGVGESLALTYAILIHAMILITYVVLGLGCSLALQAAWWSRLWGFVTAPGKAEKGER